MKKIYMIGIGGASMSAMAIALKKFGYLVAGSDKVKGEYIDLLQEHNIPVYHEENYVEIAESDCIVYSAAIAKTHEEYYYAESNAMPLLSRAELLQLLLEQFVNKIAVAGCHGKSSTSAMLMHMLYGCTQNASMHIGAKDKVYNNFYFGGQKYFVTEACEYKQNFLTLYPDVAIILNTENDHMECYADTESLENSYKQFASQAKHVIVYEEDKLAESLKSTYTFGFTERADIQAKDLYNRGGKYSFTLCIQGVEIGRVHLHVYGKFAVQHALATFAVAKLYNLDMHTAIKAVEKFTGIARRMEVLREDERIHIIADYAHHPTELKASIETVKKMTTGRVHILFQPHTYSRTMYFFNDFIELLRKEENVILYKTFAARERYRKKGSAKTLAKAIEETGKEIVYMQNAKELKNYIAQNMQKGDTLLCLGAGDIYMTVQNLSKKL